MVPSDKRYFSVCTLDSPLNWLVLQTDQKKVLLKTYNLFGFQDRTGLPGQRSLKALNGYDLHNSIIAIESIHILSKL